MSKTFRYLSVPVLIAVLCLSGCARLKPFHPKEQKQIVQPKELKKIIKADWGIQRQKDEIRNQEWGACGQGLEPESVCGRQRDPKFAVYKLGVFYSDGGPMDVSKALYCPQENQYWIDETAGNDPIKCRLLGPFSLDNNVS